MNEKRKGKNVFLQPENIVADLSAVFKLKGFLEKLNDQLEKRQKELARKVGEEKRPEGS